MVKRSYALCNDKIVGIESIYTLIDGKQINIPERVKELRVKSRKNELFCPCGCGANLILIAGDKNLREQHFRVKHIDPSRECDLVSEGKVSVESKIVLKCWLDENLHANDLESRVQICAMGDSSRKYEFTFLTREKKIAVSYCYARRNLSDEKLSILEEHGKGISLIYIVDIGNGGSEGQYPEGLMKVQERQKYCLLLDIQDIDYAKAMMSAVFYEKDVDGLWQEIKFSEGPLHEYRIGHEGELYYGTDLLTEMYSRAHKEYQENLRIEIEKRDAEKRRREEQQKEILRRMALFQDAHTLMELFRSSGNEDIIVRNLEDEKTYVVYPITNGGFLYEIRFNSVEIDLSTGELLQENANWIIWPKRNLRIWKTVELD